MSINTATTAKQQTATPRAGSFISGARVLSIGIAITGLVTFAYFIVASHIINPVAYDQLTVLWSLIFIIASVIYRPIEQFLARSISANQTAKKPQRATFVNAASLQFGFALAFLVVALIFRQTIIDQLLDGSFSLYLILVITTVAYSASYFARGWFAGNQRFLLYGALVFFEAIARLLFALVVMVGVISNHSTVAWAIAVAPLFSLVVLPLAWTRHKKLDNSSTEISLAEVGKEESNQTSLKRSAGFAISVFVIMAAEQALLNASVLTVDFTSPNPALAGFVFNLFLIVRVPLQLFQAVQTSLLPHLTKLITKHNFREYNHTLGRLVLLLLGLSATGALLILITGPWIMDALFGGDFSYNRIGLFFLALGIGLHLVAATLNQGALARHQVAWSAAFWVIASAAFVTWALLPFIGDQVLRVEIGYLGATALLSSLLLLLHLQRRKTQ